MILLHRSAGMRETTWLPGTTGAGGHGKGNTPGQSGREEGERGNMGPLTVHREMKMRRLLAGEDAGRCL